MQNSYSIFGIILLVALAATAFLYSSQEETVRISEPMDEPVAEKETVLISFIEIDGDTYELPILNFHNIGEPPASVSASNYVWYVSEGKLETVLRYIAEYDYHPLFLSEYIHYLQEKRLPKNAIVLTFDDGARNFLTHAFPLLKKYGVKSNIMIMTGVGGKNYLSDEEIVNLYGSGLVEFQSHTRYHQYLTRIPAAEAREELFSSKEHLEDLLGYSIEAIAYPFGLYDDDIISLAEDVGYKIGMTIRAGKEQMTSRPFELFRYNVTETTPIETILK